MVNKAGSTLRASVERLRGISIPLYPLFRVIPVTPAAPIGHGTAYLPCPFPLPLPFPGPASCPAVGMPLKVRSPRLRA